MARIILVDDEMHLVWALQHSLRDEGYEVLSASNGVEALALARRFPPDLIILDLIMPHMGGHEMCQQLRRDPSLAAVPVLFLTAMSDIENRVLALDEGGDDYMIKPFNIHELKARIRALLRRSMFARHSGHDAPDDTLTLGPLALNINSCQVRMDDRTEQLTPAEFELLYYLMRHPGKVFSSQELLQQVWGYAPDTSDPSLVRWHIRNLRTKIEPDSQNPTYIQTIPHHGYILSLS